jgi:hypothetical protein
MRREASDEFKSAFDAAFSVLKIESRRARDLRIELELTSDLLAGPMYSVLTSGSHDYVFSDKEGRFSGVVDASSFRAWAICWPVLTRKPSLSSSPEMKSRSAIATH